MEQPPDGPRPVDPATMKASIRRVYDALITAGIEPKILQFTSSTRTAADAAESIKTTVGQIVKSLVFLAGGELVLLLVSGSNMVNPERLSLLLGGKHITRADADTVRATTGFAIGGVPPTLKLLAVPVYIDADLMHYPLLWAAAGTPNTVFPCTPDELLRISGGNIVELT